MVVRLFSIIGSSASLIGLVLIFHPANQSFSAGEGFLLGAGLLLTLLAAGLEIKDYLTSRPKSYKTKKKIRDYMYRWISGGGTVCVFSNDLSWVEDDEMIAMLQTKAKAGELKICLPRMVPIAQRLKDHGADIIIYEKLGFLPQSRFTIINLNRMDAQVAVGRRVKGQHVIEEFGAGDHPVFSVASDLVEVVTRYSQTRRKGRRANREAS